MTFTEEKNTQNSDMMIYILGKVRGAMLSCESHKLRIQIQDVEECSEFWNRASVTRNSVQELKGAES